MKNVSSDLLHTSTLFNGLHKEDIRKICAQGRFEDFEKGDIIIREGQKTPCLCLLLEGSADVILPKIGKDFERIDNVDLSRKKTGDCFGEYSFLDGKPASATVVAVETCKIFAITKENFMEFLESDDFLAKRIYYNLSRIFVKKMREVVEDSETFILL